MQIPIQNTQTSIKLTEDDGEEESFCMIRGCPTDSLPPYLRQQLEQNAGGDKGYLGHRRSRIRRPMAVEATNERQFLRGKPQINFQRLNGSDFYGTLTVMLLVGRHVDTPNQIRKFAYKWAGSLMPQYVYFDRPMGLRSKGFSSNDILTRIRMAAAMVPPIWRISTVRRVDLSWLRWLSVGQKRRFRKVEQWSRHAIQRQVGIRLRTYGGTPHRGPSSRAQALPHTPAPIQDRVSVSDSDKIDWGSLHSKRRLAGREAGGRREGHLLCW